MNLLFDTNIILWIARDTSGYKDKVIEAMTSGLLQQLLY